MHDRSAGHPALLLSCALAPVARCPARGAMGNGSARACEGVKSPPCASASSSSCFPLARPHPARGRPWPRSPSGRRTACACTSVVRPSAPQGSSRGWRRAAARWSSFCEYRKARLIFRLLNTTYGCISERSFELFITKADILEAALYERLKVEAVRDHFRAPDAWFRAEAYREMKKQVENLPIFSTG